MTGDRLRSQTPSYIPSPAQHPGHPAGARTSLVLLGGTVGGVHGGLEVLLLQGLGLTALGEASSVCVTPTSASGPEGLQPPPQSLGTEGHARGAGTFWALAHLKKCFERSIEMP